MTDQGHKKTQTIAGIIDEFLQEVADFIFPKKTTPNEVTTGRIIMIIPLLFCLLVEQYLMSIIIFLTAGILDLLDGPLARKRKMITNEGKLLDPTADKVLIVVPVLVLLLADPILHLNLYLALGIVITESILIVIATIKYFWPHLIPKRQLGSNWFGKIKMTSQFIGVIILICSQYQNQLNDIAHYIFIAAVLLAIMSILGHLFGWGTPKYKHSNKTTSR